MATERRHSLLAVLFLAAILAYADRLVLTIMVEPIKQTMGLTDLQIGTIQGPAFAVLYAFSGFLSGWWADHRHRVGIIAFGIVLWSGATLLSGLATDYHQLLGLRALVGVGEACLAPAAISLIGDHYPPEARGKAIGTFFSGLIIGAATGVVVGGLMLDYYSGSCSIAAGWCGLEPWRRVFLTLGAAGLPVALLVLRWREPRRDVDQTSFSIINVARSYTDLLWSRRESRPLLLLIAGVTFAHIGDYGITAWVPAYFMRNFDVPAATAGVLLGIAAIIAGVIGTAASGILGDLLQGRHRQGRLCLAILGFLLSIPALVFAYAPDVTATVILFGIYTALISFAVGAFLASVQDIVPSSRRGVATSCQAFAYTIFGMGIGPVAVASLAGPGGSADGLAAAMAGLSVLTLLLCAAFVSAGARMMARCDLRHAV